MLDVPTVVPAPAADVWDALVDTRTWSSWGPSVRGVELDPDTAPDAPRISTGARGRVVPPVGPPVPFEVTRVEPGERWDWEVLGVPVTGHRVEPLDPDRCRVVFEVPVWAAPYAAVCAVAGRRLRRLVAG
ncbi:MAG: SRPBCC family protein [Actinomycetes bacterium]